MNECYSLFISKFGEPTQKESVPEEVISKYYGLLPDSFLDFWREYGWCSFKGGLFWTVNPERLHGVFLDWIAEIPELSNFDYVVFARSAFGSLSAWCIQTGHIVELKCAKGYILTDKDFRNEIKERDLWLQVNFASSAPKNYDFADENEIGLFQQAMDTIGPLARDEVYGFEPLLVLGGSATISNLKKFRMDVHLTIMREFTDPVLSLV